MMVANKLTEIVMKQQKSTSKKPSLDELVFGALSQLQALDYNPRSIRRYQSTWNRLIKFAKQHNFENKLSERLISELPVSGPDID
jgi:Rps23 Pro-64 3,4-dihydroxylase Tpa1-like proline 4-hydroxylase